MFLRSALLGILLFSILWTETALAGSSFLSPEFKKLQQQNYPRKPSTQLHRRGTGGFWDPDEAEAEDNRNGIEIKFNIPFEMGVRITEEEYEEYGQVLEKMLGDTLGVSAQATQMKN